MVKRALTARHLTDLVSYSDPQLVPGSHTYFFTETKMNHEKDCYMSHLHAQNISTGEQKQWTFGDQKDSHPRISADGKYIAFQSDRSGTLQIWLMPANGGEATQLTTFRHGAYRPEWSPDGNFIFFSAPLNNGDQVDNQQELSENEKKQQQEEKDKKPLIVSRLAYKSDGSGFADDKRTQIIMYSLQEKSFTQLTTADSDHYLLDISPDAKSVLFAANLQDDADYTRVTDLYKLDTASKAVQKLTNSEGTYQQAVFSPDGKKIACLGHGFSCAGATQDDLFVFDTADGTRTCLSEGWDIQLGDNMISDFQMGASEIGPAWSADSDELYFIASKEGATGLYSMTLDGRKKTLFADNNHIAGFAYQSLDESFVLHISKPTEPVNFYLLTAKGQISRLTEANADFLAETALIDPEEIKFQAEDGWHLQGWLLKPYGFESGKKYPFILEIHGGPHAMYGRTFFHEMQLLAAKGYVVLYINPRGSYGYGQEFVDACRKDYGGKDYTDLMAAVDYALKAYDFIDEDRLGVTGGSYGGFMTNWIVGHTNRFKAAVTQRSISNWLSFYGVSDIGYFFTEWEHGLNLLDDPKKLWEFSPLKYAANVETPLLILHGEHDYRCPIEQGEQLYVTLKHFKKEVAFVRFPHATHELSRSGAPKMRLERLHQICSWFEKHL